MVGQAGGDNEIKEAPLHTNSVIDSLPPKAPLAELNGQHHVLSTTEAKLQGLLTSPQITGPIHLGTEVAKVLFTDESWWPKWTE